MIKLKTKKYHLILTKKQQKYQHYHQAKRIKMNILQAKKYYRLSEKILPSYQSRIIEQANFTYSPLGKAFEKQTKTIEEQGKKQVEVLEDLKLEKNKEGTKSIEGLFRNI